MLGIRGTYYQTLRRFRRSVRRAGRSAAPRVRVEHLERMEGRQLFSASPAAIEPGVEILHPAAASSSVQGYSPSEIRSAYGFDQVTLPNGSAADGSGQTIAIVDAYNDPNIAADLHTFDQQFDLSDPTLQVVNQTGGTKLPGNNPGWDGEIALDVEWAHAVSPGAKILLVEADSSSVDDLMAGVDYARQFAGVSVVSMSWGGSEFFSWGGGEFSSQTDYDPDFTTPTGHQGVTFIAAAGDSGSASGVEWPAASPNVLSVGGTSLSPENSTQYFESGWSGTSGGFSQVEPEPTYQQTVQDSGARSVPDVAYVGDPNTGFAVYDSVADQGYGGWEEVGGTSAGSPQWASLVALANQVRAANGQNSLEGATQVLPILYSLYPTQASDGTVSTTTYDSSFNDVQTGGGSSYRFRWGGFGTLSYRASVGYDEVTGLGSPQAQSIVEALAAASSSNSGSGGTDSGGTSGSTTTPAQLPASPVSLAFVSEPPASVLAGDAGSITLRLTNATNDKFSGPVTITLYASTDGSTSGATTLATVTLPGMKLKVNGSKKVKVRFAYGADLSGSYTLVAAATAVGMNTADAEATSAAPVAVGPADADLSVAFSGGSYAAVTPGATSPVDVTITNEGNVAANGPVTLILYATTDPTATTAAEAAASGEMAGTLPAHAVHLAPGKSKTFRVRFTAPSDLPGGEYDLMAVVQSNTQPGDGNPDNDTAAIPTVQTFGGFELFP